MSVGLQFIIYMAILLFALVCSMRHYKQLDLSLKMISILLAYTVVSEAAAAFAGWRYRNNMPIYHFYTPISFALIALHYNYYHKFFQKYRIGYYLAGMGIVMAILNTIYLEPLMVMDSNASLFVGLFIIGMGYYTLFEIYKHDEGGHIFRNPYIWISILFLIYWNATFLIWILIEVLEKMDRPKTLDRVYLSLWIINVLFYLGMGLVFLILNPKGDADGR